MDHYDGELPKSIEYITLQSLSAKVEIGIQQSGLEELSSVLFSEGLIDLQMKSVASNPGVSNQTRAANVLNALLFRIKTLPADLEKIINALSSIDTLGYLGQQLKDKREEFAQKERERIEALQKESEHNQQRRNEMHVSLPSRASSSAFSSPGYYFNDVLNSTSPGPQASAVRDINVSIGMSPGMPDGVWPKMFDSFTSPKGSPSDVAKESLLSQETTTPLTRSRQSSTGIPLVTNLVAISPKNETTATSQSASSETLQLVGAMDIPVQLNPPIHEDRQSEPKLLEPMVMSDSSESSKANTYEASMPDFEGGFTAGEQVLDSSRTVTIDDINLPPGQREDNSSSESSISSRKSCSQTCFRHASVESTSSLCSAHDMPGTDVTAAGGIDEASVSPDSQQETNRSHSSESFVLSNPKNFHRSISCPKCMKKQLKKLKKEIEELKDINNQYSLQSVTQQLETVSLRSTYEGRERQYLQERTQLQNDVIEKNLIIERMKVEYEKVLAEKTKQDTKIKQMEEELKDVKSDAYDLGRELKKEKQKTLQCPQCNVTF